MSSQRSGSIVSPICRRRSISTSYFSRSGPARAHFAEAWHLFAKIAQKVSLSCLGRSLKRTHGSAGMPREVLARELFFIAMLFVEDVVGIGCVCRRRHLGRERINGHCDPPAPLNLDLVFKVAQSLVALPESFARCFGQIVKVNSRSVGMQRKVLAPQHFRRQRSSSTP